MGNPAGVRRDFDALEKRRFEAIRRYERGENQSAIARQVKVVRQTVARWVQQYRAQGKLGLRKAGRAGRKPGLSEKDRQRLHTLLLQGPERLGYETPLWTCPRVAHLIEQEFGVRYHEGQVWNRQWWSGRQRIPSTAGWGKEKCCKSGGISGNFGGAGADLR